MGSPPPTRGTHRCIGRPLSLPRITPAYAGNTLVGQWYSSQYGDHPRLRGEHATQLFFSNLFRGSPPPTRGTPLLFISVSVVTGITPAYAGNTGKYKTKRRAIGDHPRLRGEHATQLFFSNLFRGSPPPTRGTLYRSVNIFDYGGITPAYAGNT